jgi:autotransporter-associated beta strand protein
MSCKQRVGLIRAGRGLQIGLAVAALLAMNSVATAASNYWNTASSGTWQTTTYWSLGVLPGPGDWALVGHGGTATISSSTGAVAVARLYVAHADSGGNSGAGTVNITGGALTVSEKISLTKPATGSAGKIVQTGGAVTALSEVLINSYFAGSASSYTQSAGTNVTGTLQFCPDEGGFTGWQTSYSLNGGTLTTGAIVTAGSGAGSAVATFNLGGGTLQASAGFSVSPPLSGTFTMALTSGTSTIDTQSYSPTFSCAVSGSGALSKMGSGTLTLSGGNTYSGLTTVKAGTLELVGASAQGRVLSGGGSDIQAGKIVFDYPSQAATILPLITTSYNGGLWNTGKFKNTTQNATHGLGWADDGSSKVTVMYTLYGDSDLDGSVNGTDLNTVLSNYNLAGAWSQGDFDYSGTVDGADLNIVLSNYNQSLSMTGPAVPEPGTLGMLALGAAGILAWSGWRRRY